MISGLLLLGACDDGSSRGVPEATPPAAVAEQRPDDMIARVGDQVITFSEITATINTAAAADSSIPAYGTPERDDFHLTLLDKLISANLIYLDALNQGLDRDPAYRGMIEVHSDAELVSLYRETALAREPTVSDAEVEAFYQRSDQPQGELTDAMRTAIMATLRKHKQQEQPDRLWAGLREGIEIAINETALDPGQDATRAASERVATIGVETLTWGDAQRKLPSLHAAVTTQDRLELLNNFADYRILVQKARAAHLDQDPVYKTRIHEISKNHLVKLQRRKLLAAMEPSPEEIRAYYADNRHTIATPRMRKVQMVVAKTRKQAVDILNRIEAGELTLSKAAAEYSIAPGAARNLGETGWVGKDTGSPALDELTFALAPGEIGGPVESSSGWHLVLVQGMRPPIHVSIGNEATHQEVRRRLLQERLDKYTDDLRLAGAKVEIYEDVIREQARRR